MKKKIQGHLSSVWGILEQRKKRPQVGIYLHASIQELSSLQQPDPQEGRCGPRLSLMSSKAQTNSCSKQLPPLFLKNINFANQASPKGFSLMKKIQKLQNRLKSPAQSQKLAKKNCVKSQRVKFQALWAERQNWGGYAGTYITRKKTNVYRILY